MSRLICALALATLVQVSTQDDGSEQFLKCFPANKLTESDPQAMSSLLTKSRLQFGVAFIKEVLQNSRPGENFFFSPHSVHRALLLALFISNDRTEKNLKAALRLPTNIDKLDVLRAYKIDSEFEKMRSTNASVSYELNNVNRFYHEATLPVRECMKSLFAEEMAALDFKTNPLEAKEIINRWVANQTGQQIQELLKDADVDISTKLILVNAMYFKGLWASKFRPENTKKEVFYINSQDKALVPMMRQTGNFKYLISEKLGAHAIQLPYKGEDISMFILLPPTLDPHGIEFLLEKLTVEMIADLVEPNYMIERPVELRIPKFTIERELENFVDILKTLGVDDLFSRTADFSSFTGKRDIFFNDAKHKAKVTVDEEGTVAAAATAVFTFRSSRPLDPVKFVCNHPFIYFIYDNVSQSILFIGAYNSPA